MDNVQEFRLDGSKIERDEDGYPSNPRVGDVDYGMTCMECEKTGKTILFDIVTWDAGRVEEWYCDPCFRLYEDREVSNA